MRAATLRSAKPAPLTLLQTRHDPEVMVAAAVASAAGAASSARCAAAAAQSAADVAAAVRAAAVLSPIVEAARVLTRERSAPLAVTYVLSSRKKETYGIFIYMCSIPSHSVGLA